MPTTCKRCATLHSQSILVKTPSGNLMCRNCKEQYPARPMPYGLNAILATRNDGDTTRDPQDLL